MFFIAPHIQTHFRGQGAGPKKVAARTRMIMLRNRAKDGEGWLQGFRLGARASKGPSIPRHALFIDQAPNIEPYLSQLTCDVEGKATVAHHGEGARENVRNVLQTISMHPLLITHIVLNLRRRPLPSQQAVINSRGRGILRASSMREDGKFQGAQKERRVFLGIGEIRSGRIITGKDGGLNR